MSCCNAGFIPAGGYRFRIMFNSKREPGRISRDPPHFAAGADRLDTAADDAGDENA